MSSNVEAIVFASVAKRYRIGTTEKYSTLRESLSRIWGPRRVKGKEFWALRDVSFTVHAGETFGIIGRNGAGKSTLLKILARITPPTAGEIYYRGRLASLLEVGTGFHPELTGRENIFLNGAVLGMRRAEIRRAFESIVEFAGVSLFLDTPVKRYSSGMYVRLAFAVAAHLRSEILVVDEVLAVGDAEFQAKCLDKMADVTREGRTVLFVSHNMGAVRQLCKRAAVLGRGRVEFVGSSDESVDWYSGRGARSDGVRDIVAVGTCKNAAVQLSEIKVNGSTSTEVVLASTQRAVSLQVMGKCDVPARLSLEATLHTVDGTAFATFTPTQILGIPPQLCVGRFVLDADFSLPRLRTGHYWLSLYLTNPRVEGYWDFSLAVRLEVEGWAAEGMPPAPYSGEAGGVILDGSVGVREIS